jgi:tartrate-resistant acid phosphatase type 5
MSHVLHLCAASAVFALVMTAQPGHAQTRFAAVGDMGNSTAATSVANLIKNQSVDHVITTGDNCYGSVALATQVGNKYGNFVEWRRFWPSLGNHEYSDACGNRSKAYLAYFDLPNNERYYDVRLGPVHLFVINSDRREPHGVAAKSRQARWFKRKIQASSAPWQVVAFHHPPYSSGEHGSSAALRWPFEAWGVDAVLNGHDHNYERIIRDDNQNGTKLPYFVTGLGGRGKDPIPRDVEGSAFKYSAEFGALFLEATERQIKFEFRNIKGVVVDTYTISK